MDCQAEIHKKCLKCKVENAATIEEILGAIKTAHTEGGFSAEQVAIVLEISVSELHTLCRSVRYNEHTYLFKFPES